jgi:hypothetical protein
MKFEQCLSICITGPLQILGNPANYLRKIIPTFGPLGPNAQ